MISWHLAQIFPFQPYRYTAAAGAIENLVTQPYDKISPELRARYLAASPYNLVRIILGERSPSDSEADSVYTRAAQLLNYWIGRGILAQDPQPGFYAYFQEFRLPDSNESLTRKGFIGLGQVEPYAARIVHRHEQTLTGPKKDRMEVLKATRAHFGQIFMLYADPDLVIDHILDRAAQAAPLAIVENEPRDCATHRMWQITDPEHIAEIQRLMADKKLLIADGHHRYETALAFRDAHPELADAQRVMMTFVNMHSPGLKILATNRVVSGLDHFDAAAFFAKAAGRKLASLDELKRLFAVPAPDHIRIGVAVPRTREIHLIERPRAAGELDVQVLHQELLGEALGISEEAVREERNLHYVRGLEAAYARVESGEAQIAFLLEPTTVAQVADVAFSGGVMPQKSTDFFPKLLSGMTFYKLDK